MFRTFIVSGFFPWKNLHLIPIQGSAPKTPASSLFRTERWSSARKSATWMMKNRAGFSIRKPWKNHWNFDEHIWRMEVLNWDNLELTLFLNGFINIYIYTYIYVCVFFTSHNWREHCFFYHQTLGLWVTSESNWSDWCNITVMAMEKTGTGPAIIRENKGCSPSKYGCHNLLGAFFTTWRF